LSQPCQPESEKLFQIYWNEKQIDELNAWLKARNLIPLEANCKIDRVVRIENVLKPDKGLQPLVWLEKVALFLA